MKPSKAEGDWFDRLRAVMNTQPPNTWIYVANGTVHLMRYGPDGTIAIRPGSRDGFDPNYSVESVFPLRAWDGGDW